MRILLVAPASKSSGGISRWTQHIKAFYESLNAKSVDLEFFDTARSEFIPDDIAFIPRVKLAIKDYSIIIRDFKQVLKNGKYDVVHITSSAGLGLLRDLYMIRAIRKNGARSIVHFRFGRIPQLSEDKNWEWKLVSCVVKNSDRVIVIDKRSFQSLVGIGSKNVCLLPNMIAPRVENAINNTLKVERVPRRILFVGHCIATKGVYELVEACKMIPNIKLVLLGAIKEEVKGELQRMSGGEDWLEILGEKPYPEVIKEMRKCDVFVLPSYTEGFPNVILEAMACNCAIVTTPVGAIPEILDIENESPCGICVPVKDVLLLRDSITRLIANPELAVQLGERARKRVYEEYSMTSIWEELVSIWKEVTYGDD